ncbi:MAG TPA: MFS transporter, partial [Clostridia bacterium]|nr:MFS transporter [Clostridia bacterium]
IQAFFNLAINASIPNFVGKEKVPKVNSAFQGLGAIINITGPILGAMLYKEIGMEMILIINAVSYILSGISEAFLVYNKQGEMSETVQSGSYIQNVKEVFAYLDTEKILKFLLTMAVILNALLNPMVLLVLQYITYNVIKISGIQLSLIQSSWAMGSIIGAVFVITRKTVEPILKRFFVLLEAQALLIILWIFPRLPLFSEASMWTITVIYILLIFSYGMLNTIQNVPLISHYQLKIPEALRGRVFGVLYTALNISTPIGMWIFGIALQKADWIYIPVVAGMTVFIICMTQSRNKYFREFVGKLNN